MSSWPVSEINCEEMQTAEFLKKSYCQNATRAIDSKILDSWWCSAILKEKSIGETSHKYKFVYLKNGFLFAFEMGDIKEVKYFNKRT